MASLIRLAAAIAAVASTLAASAATAGGASGGLIVFSATTPASQVEQLFSIRPSGGGLRQLTTGVRPALAPAFSPDGKRLAFARFGAGLFTINRDGSGLRRLTANGRDSYPTWSPDGRSIAFVRPLGARWRVYVVPSTGGRLRQLRAAPPAGRPSWTKAGLLVPSGGDLLAIDTTTGHVLRYYGANVDAIWGLNTVALSPSVSWLTYVGSREPEPGDKECGEGPCQRFGLYLESLTGKRKKPEMIAKDAGAATFSPNGSQLVFAARGRLVVRSVASGSTRTISTGEASPTSSAPPAWR